MGTLVSPKLFPHFLMPIRANSIKFSQVENAEFQYQTILKNFTEVHTVKQERQIVARYARLTPSCKAGACTGQNSSMKNNKGH